MSNALRKMVKDKYFNKVKQSDFERFESIARREAKSMEKRIKQEVCEEAFYFDMAIALNVLLTEYWKKASKKKIVKFVEECKSLHESCKCGAVSGEDLISILDEYNIVRHNKEKQENSNNDRARKK